MLVKYGWHALMLAIAGEIIVPFVLGTFYRGYRHDKMVISLLGSPDSPVRKAFSIWMLAAGVLFLISAPAVYSFYKGVSIPLSATASLFIGLFAIGACIFSCFFSVNETKETVTAASKIHGAGSAAGFTLLLFVPLIIAVLSFRKGDTPAGAVSAASFILALASFILFIMSDKPALKHAGIAREGLWQRLNLFFMYLPLAYIAASNIF